MASRAVLISIVVLRFLTLVALAGSIAVLVTNKFTLSDGTKFSFKNVIAYRYVLATGIVGFMHTLVQIPFAIYHASKEKRLIRNECLPEFDFYGDKIIAFLLATGVGAGFAITFEFKKLLNDFVDSLAALGVPGLDEGKSKSEKFLDKANISIALLFLGFLCMVILSVFSSINKASTSKSFFG